MDFEVVLGRFLARARERDLEALEAAETELLAEARDGDFGAFRLLCEFGNRDIHHGVRMGEDVVSDALFDFCHTVVGASEQRELLCIICHGCRLSLLLFYHLADGMQTAPFLCFRERG